MAHLLARQISRAPRRKYTELAGQALKDDIRAQEEHAASTTRTWKLLSLIVAVPAMAFCAYNAYTKEMEHHEHPRPEFQAYKHLRVRAKPFPWGDGNHSLFHNSHANALPEGYED